MAATYAAQITREWNWNAIVQDAHNYTKTDSWSGETVGRCFLGTVFSIMPSGKYYMPFACSNVTEKEAAKDERYYAALETVAGKFGGWIESGEGDPCDLFFCMSVDAEEDEEDEDTYADNPDDPQAY